MLTSLKMPPSQVLLCFHSAAPWIWTFAHFLTLEDVLFFLLPSSALRLWGSLTFNPACLCVQSPRRAFHGTSVCHFQSGLCKKFIHSFDIFEILIRCQALHEGRGMRQAWVRQNACSQQPYSLGKTTGLVPGAGTYWSEREQRVMIKKLGKALRVWLAVCDECDQSKSIHDQHVSDTNYPWHFWSEPVLKCNRA